MAWKSLLYQHLGSEIGIGRACLGEGDEPVFIITCVVARLTFFLKPVVQGGRLALRWRRWLVGKETGDGGVTYPPTTCWVIDVSDDAL
jgi:hypothetical protein